MSIFRKASFTLWFSLNVSLNLIKTDELNIGTNIFVCKIAQGILVQKVGNFPVLFICLMFMKLVLQLQLESWIMEHPLGCSELTMVLN